MIAAELSVLPENEARRAPRRIVNIAAAVRDGGATMRQVRVLDVSASGCKVETDPPLDVGVQVWLKLPGLETKRSRIVWTDGELGGCEFEVPLHPGEIALLFPRRISKRAIEVFRRR